MAEKCSFKVTTALCQRNWEKEGESLVSKFKSSYETRPATMEGRMLQVLEGNEYLLSAMSARPWVRLSDMLPHLYFTTKELNIITNQINIISNS